MHVKTTIIYILAGIEYPAEHIYDDVMERY